MGFAVSVAVSVNINLNPIHFNVNDYILSMQYNNLTFLLSFFNLDPAGPPDSPDGAMDSKSITALLSQGAGKTPGICFDRKK